MYMAILSALTLGAALADGTEGVNFHRYETSAILLRRPR